MKKLVCLGSLLLALIQVERGEELETKRPDFMLGVDANYSLEMEARGAHWKWNGQEQDLFAGMQKQGGRWFRVRLWTGEEGVNGKSYAAKVIERATKAGLTPYLVIFLSEDWADLTKQPVPKIWRDLSLEQRAEAVRQYAHDTVWDLRGRGLTSHIYEVGNEIDYGICGVFPGQHAKKDPDNLKIRIWPEAARLILACERGVKEADPSAKFLLHVAHWWDADFCIAFFNFMKEQQVQIDYAGLSYFPSSNIGGSLTLAQFRDVVDRVSGAIGCPIVVPETGYPSTTDFTGQFASWRNEVPGYALTPEGQQRWLTDFLKFCIAHPKIAGAFYWSPEWHGEGMWKAFALFDEDGNAKPAWQAFKVSR
jgi:arabinogalactan endo-1,4-beta-galactosidase